MTRHARNLLALGLALAACRSTTERHAPGPSQIEITQMAPVRAWELWGDGKSLGSLVRFEVPGDPSRAYFSVRNREGQEMGMVDVEGRAWRYRAHAADPEWIGSGTVFDGARRILSGPDSTKAVEIDVADLQRILSTQH